MTTIPTIEEIERRAEAAGVRMSELCKKAGVSIWTVNRYRNGQTDPTKKLRALDKALSRMEAAAQ